MVVAVRAGAATQAVHRAAGGLAGIRRQRRTGWILGRHWPAGRRGRAGGALDTAVLHLSLPRRPRRAEHSRRLAAPQPARNPVFARPQCGSAPDCAAPFVRRGRSQAGIGWRAEAGGPDARAAAGRSAGLGKPDQAPRPDAGRRCPDSAGREPVVAADRRGRPLGTGFQPRHDRDGGGIRRGVAGVSRPDGRQLFRTLRTPVVRIRQPPPIRLDNHGRRRAGVAVAGLAVAAPALGAAGVGAIPRLSPQRRTAPAHRGARTVVETAYQRSPSPDPGMDFARRLPASSAEAAQPAHRYCRGRATGKERPARPERIGAHRHARRLRCVDPAFAAAGAVAAIAMDSIADGSLVADLPAYRGVYRNSGAGSDLLFPERLGTGSAAMAALERFRCNPAGATRRLFGRRPVGRHSRRLVGAILALR